jgi:hypothetical protein
MLKNSRDSVANPPERMSNSKSRLTAARAIIGAIAASVITVSSVYAWNASSSHTITSGKQNTFAPYTTLQTSLVNYVSGGRYIYGGYNYTAWNNTAVNWLRGQSHYTALVFHIFAPNSSGGCTASPPTISGNSTWAWGNLPGMSVYAKACTLAYPNQTGEIRLVATNNASLLAGTNYWGQAAFYDWGPNAGEITFDSYLVYWWAPTVKTDNEYITKHCFRTTGSSYLPSSGSC